MDIQKNGFLSIEQLTDRYLSGGKANAVKRETAAGPTFRQVLEEKKFETEKLRFSRHASERLENRGIRLSENQMERLNDGVRRAQMKGIKDSLVIVDELAFIVNVPNQTVVTAMNSTDAEENVFTNINGAVIS